MLAKPIFTKLPAKFIDIALISLVTLMYITLCAEADMYVPAFPAMIKCFGVAENKIQLILSINFAALCVAGLITGPLSDSFGRRSVLILGLLLLVISSLGCVLTDDFYWMLAWRLLQGIAASVPMVIGAATFLDKYSAEKAGQLIGVINSVISASMAGAPIIGAYLSQMFNWRANFIAILLLATASFLGSWLFIEETLPHQKRKKFNFVAIGKDYVKLLRSFKYLSYTLIANGTFTAIVIYIANISVIFVNHLGMDLATFSYYQATTMGTFIVFSLWSVKLIGKKGIDYTKNFGGILAILGTICIFYTSQVEYTNPKMISLAMAFIAAGGALMAGTFGMKVIQVFPDMNGTSMAMMTAIRQLLASSLVLLSEYLFDGTIVPIAMIICGYTTFAIGCYIVIALKAMRYEVNPKTWSQN